MQINQSEYLQWIADLKAKILSSQLKAATVVNTELLKLYWDLGKEISLKINQSKWGSSVVEKLSIDLKLEFPNQKGFSRSNLFSMKQWYEFYQTATVEHQKVQQLVGQIPWGHNLLIISKSKTIDEALFYSAKTIENSWSRSVLSHQIELDFYGRKGKAISNFENTLNAIQTELAQETLKDPYKFDFLDLREKAVEKDIEDQLVQHITSFLLELGSGFSFVGRQVPLNIDKKEYYIDLLFYHFKLKCFVVIELKTNELKAEYVGKLNFYLSGVDEILKTETDNPSIGILLCKSKSKVVAEYALRGMSQPIGVAEYQLTKSIPKNLKSKLPSIEEIEKELSKDEML